MNRKTSHEQCRCGNNPVLMPGVQKPLASCGRLRRCRGSPFRCSPATCPTTHHPMSFSCSSSLFVHSSSSSSLCVDDTLISCIFMRMFLPLSFYAQGMVACASLDKKEGVAFSFFEYWDSLLCWRLTTTWQVLILSFGPAVSLLRSGI